ncbi:MAG: phosphate ABC transporter ATP-binding protein PstB [Gemmatimonadaceae bacterium]
MSTRRSGALATRDLSLWYGEARALDQVSMSLAPQAITAIVGPSGCGKSSLLRTFNRLHALSADVRVTGDVTLDGESIFSTAAPVEALRQRVGMVFQRWTPFPTSIYDNVAAGPRLNLHLARQELDAVVELALRRAALWDEVKDRLRQPARRLSGGEQQRLCIARALANDPEVLLLDEPCSALDPIATQRIEEVLWTLRAEVTIVIVTHNLQQAARLSDETALLVEGRLVEHGATTQLFTAPREERTEAFITGRYG